MPSKTIIIATGNKGKIREFNSILKDRYDEILSLYDFDNLPKIVEDGSTFAENAYIKAKVISDFLGRDTIADDSGLVVDALGGSPGIFSARYAGENATDDENIDKLLVEMKGIKNRGARFKCCIAFVSKSGGRRFFEGECLGKIASERRGDKGFGYDPVFYLPQFNKTMAEISLEMKNSISHRAKAIEKLVSYFK